MDHDIYIDGYKNIANISTFLFFRDPCVMIVW